MPWFKVDDKLHSHKKAARAGVDAMGLWVLCGSWSSDQLTDGFVPDYIAQRFDPDAERKAGRLVSADLWYPDEHDGDAGWRFHDWTDHQPTREEVERRREADRKKKAEQREKGRGETSRGDDGRFLSLSPDVSPGDTLGDSLGVSSATRPDPTRTKEEHTASASRFAEFWAAYPKKVAKGAAERAWRSATKKADPDSLITAAKDYAAQIKGTEAQFIKHPATWLNGACWLDEATPRPSSYRIEEDWSA